MQIALRACEPHVTPMALFDTLLSCIATSNSNAQDTDTFATCIA